MKQPVFQVTPENIDALLDLAAFVKQWFMPYAVTCECNGAEESCRKALSDPRVVQQADTVTRISDHIEKLARGIDYDYQESRKEAARQAHYEDQLDAMTAGLPVTK